MEQDPAAQGRQTGVTIRGWISDEIRRQLPALLAGAVKVGQIVADRLTGTLPVSVQSTIDHANLTGVTSDQHHAESHAHDGADGSGTVAHSATTGRTADDHHNQVHDIVGPDHTSASGTDGQVLTKQADGSIAWETPPGGMTNPMTAEGDLIVGGTVAGGVASPTRLGKGSDGQVLTVDPTTHLPVWATATGGGHTILDETTPLAQRSKLAFQGAGVTASDDAANDQTVVTIPGGGGGGGSASIELIIDGQGGVISTGVKADIEVPFSGTVTAWRLVANAAGSIVVDVLSAPFASFPASAASIWGGSKPTLASAQSAQATGLSIVVTAGDWWRFNVDSAATITRVTIAITIARTS